MAVTASVTCLPANMPFRFFDLPREIRNNIYGRVAWSARVPKAVKFFPGVIVAGFPCSDLQTVNRQFRKEYEEEVLFCHDQSITVFLEEDRGPPLLPDGSDQRLIAGLAKANHLTVEVDSDVFITTTPSNMAIRQQQTERTMSTILKYLPNISKATVRLHCDAAIYEWGIFRRRRLQEFSISSIEDWLFSHAIASNLDIHVIFALTQPLFQPCPGIYRRARPFHHNPLNTTSFEGTVSDGPYTWCGLHIPLASWGVPYTYEEVLESIGEGKLMLY